MAKLRPGSTVGIIGGGQLGRMLAMAAARLGYRCLILDPAPSCPASEMAAGQLTAAYDDAEALAELAAACDVVTYEFENVPVDGLEGIHDHVTLRPSPRALAVAQDRLVEKQFLEGAGLRVARHRAADSQDELVNAVAELGGRAVIKTRRLGYDGKGQIRVDWSSEDQGPSGDEFAQLASVPLIVEELIDFTGELSVIVARSADGEVRSYDPALNTHSNGVLVTSVVPAPVAPDSLSEAALLAERLVSGLEYVGVLGLELFLVSDGTLIANEFAPRVHNSGHWTEAACLVSQFEQHIRCVVGAPLGSTERHSDATMVNLIGDHEERVDRLLADGDWMVHLYGKTETRPQRKMGHATRLDSGGSSRL